MYKESASGGGCLQTGLGVGVGEGDGVAAQTKEVSAFGLVVGHGVHLVAVFEQSEDEFAAHKGEGAGKENAGVGTGGEGDVGTIVEISDDFTVVWPDSHA